MTLSTWRLPLKLQKEVSHAKKRPPLDHPLLSDAVASCVLKQLHLRAQAPGMPAGKPLSRAAGKPSSRRRANRSAERRANCSAERRATRPAERRHSCRREGQAPAAVWLLVATPLPRRQDDRRRPDDGQWRCGCWWQHRCPRRQDNRRRPNTVSGGVVNTGGPAAPGGQWWHPPTPHWRQHCRCGRSRVQHGRGLDVQQIGR